MRCEIVMTASFWQELRSHLIQLPESGYAPVNEQLAFILAGRNESKDRLRLLAREILPAGPDDLVRQSPGGIAPTPEFVTTALNRCIAEGWSLIEVHSHPFQKGAGTTFSGIDWGNDERKLPGYAALLDAPFFHATMVVGQESLDAHYYDRATKRILPIQQIIIVGICAEKEQPLLCIPTTSGDQGTQFSAGDERHQRQELFLGHQTQMLLSQATVAIVGLGGLGSFAAYELAHLGIGRLILIDPDRVETTNLNRLIGTTTADVGVPKVEVYKRLVTQIAPALEVEALPLSIVDQKAQARAKEADVLLGCVDSHGARLVLNQLAIRYIIPFIDGGSGIRKAQGKMPFSIGGQVQVVMPGVGCLECRGFINAERAHFDLASPEEQQQERERGYGLDEVAPSVVFLNGVVASLQVAEVVFLLAGSSLNQVTPPISLYNALGREVLPCKSQPSETCAACGADGVWALGDLAPFPPKPPLSMQQSIPVSISGERNARPDTEK